MSANAATGAIGVVSTNLVTTTASSEAGHRVKFYVPARARVRAKVTTSYRGGTVTDLAGFAGTAWYWRVDGQQGGEDIDGKYDPEDIGEAAVDVVIEIASILCPALKVLQIVSLLEDLKTAEEVVDFLHDLKFEDRHRHKHEFSFTVDEGWNTLEVGFRAETDQYFGTAIAYVMGVIEHIHMWICLEDFSEPPDLAAQISRLYHTPKEQMGQETTYAVTICNKGPSPANNDMVRFDEVFNGDLPWEQRYAVELARWGGFDTLLPYESRVYPYTYSFTSTLSTLKLWI